MKKVFLYGHLKEKYGAEFCFDINTPYDAVRLLAANFDEFGRDIAEGFYKVGAKKGHSYGSVDELVMKGSFDEVHIEPCIVGEAALLFVGGGLTAGISYALAAGELAATAFTIFGMSVTYGAIFAFGISLAIAGVVLLLVGVPKFGPTETTDESSFIYSGPRSVARQGGAVPIVYGCMHVAGTLVSIGISTEQIGGLASGADNDQSPPQRRIERERDNPEDRIR